MLGEVFLPESQVIYYEIFKTRGRNDHGDIFAKHKSSPPFLYYVSPSTISSIADSSKAGPASGCEAGC